MPADAPDINPDEQPVFEALLAAGVEASAAYAAVRRIREMASYNIVEVLRANFDSLQANIDSLRRENSMLRWVVGIGFTAMGILITLLTLLTKAP